MLKTVKQACKFNPTIRDYRMSEGVENISSLIADEAHGREFFDRNFVTSGMGQLFHEGMLRLSGKSDQAVFELLKTRSSERSSITSITRAGSSSARSSSASITTLPAGSRKSWRRDTLTRQWACTPARGAAAYTEQARA